MSEVVTRLLERRANLVSQMREVAERAVNENREMSGEEDRQFTSLNAEVDKLQERADAMLAGEKKAKEIEESFAALDGKPKERNAPAGTSADEKLADQFRALARGERRNIDVGLPTAFERRSLMSGRVEQRAPILTTNVPMPTSFVGQLYNFLVDTSSILQANPKIYTTSTGEALLVPRSTAEGAATWFAENAQITESNPTLSSVTLNAYKVGKTIYVSNELVTDTGFDLLGFLAEHAGRNIGIAVDTAYVAGPGTTQPTGFLSTATTISMGTGSAGADPFATVKATPLFEAYHGVPVPYRARGTWVMHDTTIKFARQIKDNNGQYLWQTSLIAGQPDTLLGRPVLADPNMEVPGATLRKIVAFGDFGGYWIRDVSPIRFDRSDDFKFDTDVVSFRALYRTDGKQGDTSALRVLTTLT